MEKDAFPGSHSENLCRCRLKRKLSVESKRRHRQRLEVLKERPSWIMNLKPRGKWNTGLLFYEYGTFGTQFLCWVLISVFLMLHKTLLGPFQSRDILTACSALDGSMTLLRSFQSPSHFLYFSNRKHIFGPWLKRCLYKYAFEFLGSILCSSIKS